jgi:prevent-host-death family protein
MWTLTEAKSRFSEVAELALTRGPQEITVATKRPVVLIAKDELEKLVPGGVKEFFDHQPKLDALAEILRDLERD